MNKRTLQKERTRGAIIRAADDLFSQSGFLNVTTVAIAEKAGVSHGAIFAHFSSRDDLIVEVIEKFGHSIVCRMHSLAESQNGLYTILEAHLQCIQEKELFYTHLIRELWALPRRACHSVVAIQAGISFHIHKATESECGNRKLKSVAPDLLFNTWIGLVHHYLLNRENFIDSGSVIEKYKQKLLDHFLHLLSYQRSF